MIPKDHEFQATPIAIERRSLMQSQRTHATLTRAGRALPWFVGAVVVLVGAGIAYSTLIKKSDEPSNLAITKTADRALARTTDFEITTTAGGELDARNKKELRSELDREANIVKIVDEGTRVKAGEILVELNGEQIQQQLDQETLEFESASAQKIAADNAYDIQLNENESKLREARLKVDLAELALQQWMEGDVEIKRQENELAISRAQLEVERLADKFLRSQELFEQGFISKDECDRDEVAYIEATSKWTTSRLQAEVYEKFQFPKEFKEKDSAVEEARAALVRVDLNNSSELASKDADKKNRERQVAVRKDKLDKLQKQLAACVIKAPQDGLVVYATSMERGWGMRGGGDGGLQIGAQVYPNQLLIVLPDTSDMIASVRVQEALAGRIKPGQVASVKVEAVGGRVFQGNVESIGVLAESGGWRDPNLREYTVKVALDIGDALEILKPSMRCEARLTLGNVADALSVPVQAVFQDGAVRYVYKEEGMKFARVPVKLGQRSDTFAQILAGVQEGDSVLLRQPSAGEVLGGSWDKARLELAGYKLGENGEPIAEGGRGSGMPQAAGKRGPGNQRIKTVAAPKQDGEQPKGVAGEAKPEPKKEAAGDTTTESKPAATPADSREKAKG